MRTHRGSRSRYIAIAGVDGCGKTTITDWLRKELARRGHDPGFIWSRFNNYTSLPFLALTRLSGHNYYRMIDGKAVGFHDFENIPRWLRFIFIGMQAVDVNFANLLRIRIPCRRHEVVICERGPWDTLVDVAADTGMHSIVGPPLRRTFCWQLSAATATLLIDRNEALIVAARPELEHDSKLRARASMYLAMAVSGDWTRIDNNGPLEDTLAMISGWLDERGY